ncbi:MAG: hypothetical protein K6F99_06880 [Lachnospiraceae bacterium]|nr:hypothetical protein [Lachnospiraceae bacterium]
MTLIFSIILGIVIGVMITKYTVNQMMKPVHSETEATEYVANSEFTVQDDVFVNKSVSKRRAD